MTTTMRTRLPARDESLVQLGVRSEKFDYLVALAGNPNTGKSTVFNAFTGLRQHTGNWPGKTVTRAEGFFTVGGDRFKLIDLPGTYSLQAATTDEEVARDALLFGKPDVTVIVLDATRLERNLNLALQVLEITPRVVVCLNLMDEARRLGIAVDPAALSRELGVPVIATAVRRGEGVDALRQAVHDVATEKLTPAPRLVRDLAPDIEQVIGEVERAVRAAEPERPNARWVALRLLNADDRVEASMPESVNTLAAAVRWRMPSDFNDKLTQALFAAAEGIASRSMLGGARKLHFDLDRTLDRWLTSPIFGFPLMILMLGVVFWLTIAGANVPSGMLADLLVDQGHPWLRGLAVSAGLPAWFIGITIDGMYLATGWVIAVMLPPMAIFFPLFTLLEDFGYLPRVAFNLDGLFRRVGAHGKQALTMCMGFGCNAAGVVATRVIDSPRERLVAIITNNFSLCNGRWPTQILMASLFLGTLAPAAIGGLISASAVVAVTLIGIGMMFLTSFVLTRTVLRGEATSFSLELPPYRPPNLLQTLYTSLVDRTLIVLWRAIVFAAPAGAVIWLVGNVGWSGVSVAEHVIGWLDPLGIFIGLNGVILLAYVVAIPANEIVIPTVLMLTVLSGGTPEAGAGAGVMFELDAEQIGALLRANGWTTLTAVNLMLFSLLHNPCSTTIYTIYRETRSLKWTTLATLLPVGMGIVVCFLVAQIWRIVVG
ncbi:MAG: ferrous iron transport protein B [Gemmatimonadaceae bacterium]|nr:ferrous iron transport protein B [Gemmatimonadaceae bacterium]